jgi:hypothetical protein
MMMEGNLRTSSKVELNRVFRIRRFQYFDGINYTITMKMRCSYSYSLKCVITGDKTFNVLVILFLVLHFFYHRMYIFTKYTSKVFTKKFLIKNLIILFSLSLSCSFPRICQHLKWIFLLHSLILLEIFCRSCVCCRKNINCFVQKERNFSILASSRVC